MEERKVTKLRDELSLERQIRQRHGSDTLLMSPAARHTHPAAEGLVSGPAITKDAEGVRGLGFECEQRRKITGGVAASVIRSICCPSRR